jgi:hypothetical protein
MFILSQPRSTQLQTIPPS